MEYFARQPLEVFAVDSQMNRLTGSIPYTSLIWHRRYNGVGEFSMAVLSHVYSPDWAYIICSDRPETGIVQKVEYSDTALTPDGRDTVTVSGFFLECLLNDVVFLVEESEEIIEQIEAPENKNRAPNPKYMTELGYSTVNEEYVYKDIATGEWTNKDGEVVSFGGVEPVEYEHNGKVHEDSIEMPDGTLKDGYWLDNKGYYTSDGGETITSVAWGTVDLPGDDAKNTYDVLIKDRGNYFYQHNDNVIVMVTGVADERDDVYTVQRLKWLNGPKERTVTVKGPWQRTDIGFAEKEGDSVQLVFDMVQKYMKTNWLYEEPDITGEQTRLDISLKYLGDIVYETLARIDACPRVQYDFTSNTTVFSVYRGADLSQEDVLPEPDPEPEVPEYTELSYIESTGTQWIATGFIPDSNTRVVCDCAPMIATAGWDSVSSYIFGIGVIANNTYDCYMAAGHWTAVWGTQMFDGLVNSPVGQAARIDFNKGHVTVSSAGQNYIDHEFTSAAFTCPSQLKLLRIERDNATGYFGKARIMSCQIYDDGVLARDFTPVMRSADGAVGLLDHVTGEFYGNSGTGAFIAGPTASTAEALAAPVVRARGASRALDYIRLEYIEGSGGQYIDSGVSAPVGFTASMDFMFTQAASNYQCIIGSHEQAAPYYRNYFMANQNFSSWNMGAYDPHTWGQPLTNTIYSVEVCTAHGDLRCSINGIDQGVGQFDSNPSRSSRTLFVLANNYPDDLQIARARLYRMSISVGGETVRNFTPAKRASDGAVGLLDSVSGEFFTNAGTGSFTAGPEIQVTGQLTFDANHDGAQGSMQAMQGIVGGDLTLPYCGFTVEGMSFTGWGTRTSGGDVYQPLGTYTLQSESDVLYAQWEDASEPVDAKVWATFNDTWGSMYGYTASTDSSNYKNTCYVLYEYDEPTQWNEDGTPYVTEREEVNDEGAIETVGYSIAYETKRGYLTVTAGDPGEPRKECFLDKRQDKPSCDSEWSREEMTEKPEFTTDMRSIYAAYQPSLQEAGKTYLANEYGIVNNLDTGTVNTDGYIREYDLGDKVDWSVEKLGVSMSARITEVEEIYESGNIQIRLTIGDQLVTLSKKIRRA